MPPGGVLFSMAGRHQHGRSGGSKRDSGRAATAGSCRGPWSARWRLFDARRRAGRVRQSKKQGAGAVLAQTGGRAQLGTQSGAGTSGCGHVGEAIGMRLCRRRSAEHEHPPDTSNRGHVGALMKDQRADRRADTSVIRAWRSHAMFSRAGAVRLRAFPSPSVCHLRPSAAPCAPVT